MSDSNGPKPEPVKPVNHRKARLAQIPLVAPVDPLPPEPPVTAADPVPPPKPVIDEKLGDGDMKLEIIVRVHSRNEVVMERTHESLLADIKNPKERWASIDEIERLFNVASTSTRVKLNGIIGPDKEPDKKKKAKSTDLLKEQMPDPFPAAPGDMEIHHSPDIGGVTTN